MDSPEMDAPPSNVVVKTEDVVSAFVEYLVDPLLPSYMVEEAPSIVKQLDLAKQMYAVVLLYNYYQRKLNPESEFVNSESFCNLVVTLRPSLKPYMKIMDLRHLPDNKKPDGPENELLLTKKTIVHACSVSLALDASKDSPYTEKWPISKVAILLVDSSKENCFMQFGSITQGVWSVIEKDVDFSNIGSESEEVGNHISKKKRITRKTLREEMDADETAFQELAFLAVKEAAGIDRADLMVMESHTTYSLTKEKTATRFFVVQWTKSKSFKRECQFPLKDAIKSMQGPLLKTIDGNWLASDVVEHFNTLPYAGIMSDWFSRNVLSKSLQNWSSGLEKNVDANSTQRTENTSHKEVSESKQLFSDSTQNSEVGLVNNSSQKIDNPCDKEVTINRGKSDRSYCITKSTGEKVIGNRESDRISGFSDSCGNNESPKQKDGNGCQKIGLFDSSRGPLIMDVDDIFVAHLDKVEKRKSTRMPVKAHHNQKQKTYSTESDINALAGSSKVKAQVTDSTMGSTNSECRGEKVDNGNKTSIILNSSNKDGMPTGDPALAPFQMNNKDAEKAEVTDTAVKTTITKCGDENVKIGNKTPSTGLSDQDGRPIGDQAAVHVRQNSEYLEKLQLTLAAKENELSQAALGVLLRKRQKLCHQLRNLEDEIAVCYKNIQTILDGGNDHIALKIEAIIDSCKDACLQGQTQSRDRIYRLVEEQHNSCQYAKGKRLSEAILTPQNPSLELDDFCNQNNWVLPTYRVSPSDGGFEAKVTVKGVNFECTNGSESRPSPLEARDSAASQMIAKLRTMATHTT